MCSPAVFPGRSIEADAAVAAAAAAFRPGRQRGPAERARLFSRESLTASRNASKQ